MKISFYLDEMVKRALAVELRKQGFEAVLANDIGMTKKLDEEHLAEAATRRMILVTLDKPFAGRTIKRSDHAGLICWTEPDQPIGKMLRALTEFAETHTAESAAGHVFWLK